MMEIDFDFWYGAKMAIESVLYEFLQGHYSLSRETVIEWWAVEIYISYNGGERCKLEVFVNSNAHKKPIYMVYWWNTGLRVSAGEFARYFAEFELPSFEQVLLDWEVSEGGHE